MQNAAIAQVAEDFMDTTSDLKQLEKAAKAPAGKNKYYYHCYMKYLNTNFKIAVASVAFCV